MRTSTVQGVVVRLKATKNGQEYLVLWSPEFNHSFILKDNVTEAEWISATPGTWREFDVSIDHIRGPEGIQTEAFNLRHPFNESTNPCTKATDAYTDIHNPRVLRVFTEEGDTIKFSDIFDVPVAQDKLINGLFLKNVEINSTDLKELKKYGIMKFTGSAILKTVTKASDTVAWTIKQYVHEGKELSFHGYCSKLGHLRHGRGGTLCSKNDAKVPPDTLRLKAPSQPSRFCVRSKNNSSSNASQSTISTVPSSILDMPRSTTLPSHVSTQVFTYSTKPSPRKEISGENKIQNITLLPEARKTYKHSRGYWFDPHRNFSVDKCDTLLSAQLNYEIILSDETYNITGCIVHFGDDHLLLFTPLKYVWKVLVKTEELINSPFLKENKLRIGEWMNLDARFKIYDVSTDSRFSHVAISKPVSINIKKLIPNWEQRIRDEIEFLIIVDITCKGNLKDVYDINAQKFYLVESENGAVAIVPEHRIEPLFESQNSKTRHFRFWARRGLFMFDYCLHLYNDTPIEQVFHDGSIELHKSIYPSQLDKNNMKEASDPSLLRSFTVLLEDCFVDIMNKENLTEEIYDVKRYIDRLLSKELPSKKSNFFEL